MKNRLIKTSVLVIGVIGLFALAGCQNITKPNVTPAPQNSTVDATTATPQSTQKHTLEATSVSKTNQTKVNSPSETPPSSENLNFDFSTETVGAQPESFVPVVGNWNITDDDGNKILMVNGLKWKSGQPAIGIADRAKTIYSDKYEEFLNSVASYADYPYAVATGIDNFNEGEISLRFKAIDGRIDQNIGIMFNLQPNGDYLTVRGSALENNLVLWKVVKGNRSAVKSVNNVPTAGGEWHTLKITVKDKILKAYLDDTLYLTDTLDKTVSGHVGVWSKADSVVYVDDFIVK